VMYAGDFEYSIRDLDFRGAAAYAKIAGARKIGSGVASEIFGWYLEGAYHFWPEACKKGKLKNSDAVVFVRYDDINTQFDMPNGVARSGAGDRDEWTFGVGFYPVPNLVIKADYQIRNDATSTDVDNLFNLGIGWSFGAQ